MKREDLERFGEELSSNYADDGRKTTSFSLVSYFKEVVGVGVFHSGNNECSLAIIDTKEEGRMMLGRLSEEFPIEASEMQELQQLYKRLSSLSKS
ncbi:hypothetical protein [Sphingobacterium sp. LRF_L2]|uniref:hypothetical protein n=1 Tax=Sphingobacterium sp. LRF_L2 TaxID=3369421 RepID=UPI003F63F43C